MTTNHAFFRDRHRLARSPELASLFEDVTNRFDFVVLDTAPVLANSDALAMLRHAQAHILVRGLRRNLDQAGAGGRRGTRIGSDDRRDPEPI